MERKRAFYDLLQFKIHLGVQFILVLCFFALGYFIYATQLNFLMGEIRSQGTQQVGMVAESSAVPMQRGSYYFLEELAAKVEYSPLVAYCQILDAQGNPLLQKEVRDGQTRSDIAAAYSSDDVMIVEKDIAAGDTVLGKVKLGMFINKAREEVKYNTIRLVAAFAVVLGVITVFLYVFLNRQLILPVVNLSMLTQTLSKGEFVTTTLDRRRDELGVLAQGFNDMSRNLRDAYRTLERKVEARTEDLNSAYNELQAIFDNSLIGIAVLSGDYRIIRANTRFASIFGHQTGEMSNLTLGDLCGSAQDADTVIEKFSGQMSEQGIVQAEFPFRKKSGAAFWSQVSAKTVDPADLSKGIILILEDISDRRKASQMLRQHAEDLRVAKDEADKATRSKSEFLARMSHEIRTPMNAILGMAEMLQESDLTEEQAEYVKTFSSAGELLLGIINDILDFSKIEVGQIKLESIPFSLRDLVDDVTKLFAYRAEEKDLKLTRFVSSDLAQRYIGDPTRIRQIIINLLGNAIKFTSQGGVTLDVQPSTMEDGSSCCLFSVKDTGIGIPQSKLVSIFESFAQADSSTTREFGGTGLGLAISKKLVELMGGRIWVESEINEGTTFFFALPLMEDTAVKAAEEGFLQDAVRRVLPEDTRLLIVEDNPADPASISSLVRDWNPIFTTRKTPGQAVDALLDRRGKNFHAVIIDSVVDGETSLEIAHLLIGQGIDLPHLVLVVESEGEIAQVLPGISELTSLSYVVKADRDARLLERVQEAVKAVQQSLEAEAQKQIKKVLLVDDVEANRRVVELFLKKMNVSLVHAENGKEAVEKFTEEPFDLVLMDMEMPVMDGLEATRRIRMWEQEKREYKTPIIALTAHAFQEHRQKTIDAGCTEFLAKPIKKQDLIDVVNQFSGKHAPLTEISATAQPIPLEPSSLSDVDSPVRIDPELEELRPLFLRTVYDFQSQIADAITGNDFQTLQRCGHSLKGLGSTYAVDEISQTGKVIESAAKGRQTAVIVEAAKHLAIFMTTGQTPKIQTEENAELSSIDEVAPLYSPTGRFVVHAAPDMSELIPFLMDAMQKDLVSMRKALADKDFATLHRSGHSHKGFGASYGFDYISFLGSHIQIAADRQNVEELGKLLNILEDYLKRVDIVYDGDTEGGGEETAGHLEHSEGDSPAAEPEETAQSFTVAVDKELYELIPLFLETMQKNISEMREALVSKQYEVVCRHGHSQRGLGSTYGFDYLGSLGSKIESAGVQKDSNAISALLDEMDEYLNKVHIVQKEG